MYQFLKRKKILLIALCLFSFRSVKAQIYQGREADSKLQGSEILRINENTRKISYALLNENVFISKELTIPYLIKVLGLTQPYNLQLIKDEFDEIGFEHLRFQETYNNIPVLGGVVIAHVKNQKLHSFNGEIFEVSNEKTQNLLSENACLSQAIETVGANVYKWQLPEEEEAIKIIKADKNATWFPKGELMYSPQNLDFTKPEFQLTYKFTIHANEPLSGENIYISPINNEVISRENLLHTTDVPGTAVTKYSGTKSILTDSTAPFNYRLRENTRGKGIYTLNLKKGTSYGAAVDFTDSNNVWNNVNTNKDEIATDAHWGAEVTYDYYKNVHNRKSYDNKDARIYSYVHYSSNYDNAFWNGVAMTYGDGNSFKPLTALDVCGHEITHAVTTNTAGLVYSYESGALNESFSDVFGNTIERFGRPTQYSWIIGEDITSTGTGLRNMLNPKLKNNPRCYKSTFWYAGAGDNGGVHTNSGVQNWWYYLITEGGSGINDVLNTYKVDSLGILKAEKIAYRNLSVYLTPSSQYADARFYSIQAAVDLYGDCGKEVIAVTNAWYACNVGAKYDSGFVKADFIADTVICNISKTVNFNNLSSNAKTVKWYFGDGSTSTTFSPGYNYKNYGTYSVKLVANSCFKNKSDSITKTAYIKVDSTFDICNSVLMPQSGTDSTSKCQSFVYDDGGEGNYKQLNTTILKIDVPGSDSIVLKFSDFDYENKFDSLYIYKGAYPGGTKLGGFTGNTLPFAGKNFKVAGSMITLRHFSDQLVVGRGFKMFYTAYKQPVDLTAFKDTTICIGNSVVLHGEGTGGYFTDYVYLWKTISNKDSIMVSPIVPTIYKVFLTDVCTKSVDSAQVFVDVRTPLSVTLNKDTTICVGQSISLNAIASGGQNLTYQYSWNNGLGNKSTHNVSPSVTTQYMVVLSDGCTVLNDTAYINVTVRDPLKVNLITNDTLICFNKSSALNATGKGGESTNYVYTWNNGLGTGLPKSINLATNTWLKVTLTDGCTVLPAKDSVLIKVRLPLMVSLNNDTVICKGTNVLLKAATGGGDLSNYKYTWNQGLPATKTNTVNPITQTKYILTLTDNCSTKAMDSTTVDVLQALKISGLKDTTICYGGSALLKPITTGGKPLQYQYIWDNGLNANKNQTVSPVTTTSYKLLLKDNCTTINDSATVKVTVLPALKLTANLSKPIICFGDSSQLSLNFSGGIPAQYQWFINGVQSFQNVSYLKPSLTSAYKINLTDLCSNKDSSLLNITVNPLPVVDFTSDKQLICRGDDVQFTNNTTGATSYIWTFSATDQSKVISPKYNYTKAGTFDVKLTATSVVGCVNSLTKSSYITAIELPVSNFTFLPVEPTLANPEVTFTNLSTNYTTFEWDFGDLTNEAAIADPIHKFKEKGTYKIRLVTSNSLGCSDTMITDLFVDDIYYLWVPNAFTPNNDEINNELKIVSKGVATSELAIYNRWGEKIFESDLNGKPFDGKDKDGKTLPRGSYIMEIKLRDFTKRFHIVRTVIEIL